MNGAVNILPSGVLLTPLYSLFAQAGWKTGLVTTAEITHATPAGFAVAVKSRGDSDAIAVQYLDRKVDVLLGGGSPFFSKSRRKDKRDLRADFAAAGYTVVRDRKSLLEAPVDTRLIGTFADGHLPYSLDQRANEKLRENVPTLAEMTRAALARLERSENFILQVEGARVDHAAHNSDTAAAMHDQVALDEALTSVSNSSASIRIPSWWLQPITRIPILASMGWEAATAAVPSVLRVWLRLRCRSQKS